MDDDIYVLLCAKKYSVAWKQAKKHKDNTNHWTHKKLKYALQDLKEACLKLDDRDVI